MSDGMDLNEWDNVYQEHVPPENGDFEDLPDGKYSVRVESVELKYSKAGNKMLAWELDVTSGQYYRRKIWRNHMLISDDNICWLKNDLVRCGLILEKFSDLPERLGELLDIQLIVTLKTKGTNQNVYFNKRVDSGDSGETTERQPATPAPRREASPFKAQEGNEGPLPF